MRHSEEVANIQWENITPFYQGLLKESERAIGILAFTYIESQIYEMFGQHLDSDVQGGIGSILGPQGILDAVGKQIKMLRALRWITPDTEHNLRLLARIRNRFAHAHSALTFADEKIRGYYNSLTKYEQRWAELGFSKDFPDANLQTRHTYLIRAVLTLFALYHDLVLMPSSIRAGMGPTGAFRGEFEKFPPRLQHALGTCVEVVNLIYRDAASVQPHRDSGQEP